MRKWLFLLLGVFISLPAMSQEWYGDIECYLFDDGTAAIKSVKKSTSGNLVRVKIPETIKGYECEWRVVEICDYAFENREDIGMIELPNTITTIGKGAFSRCYNLQSINLPTSLEELKDDLFHWCSSLVSIDIPNSVTSIGEGVFYECNGLTSVKLSNSLTEIKDHAFYGCSSLEAIDIPNSVTSIGNYAFCDCSGITSLIIPSSVTHIGNNAFYGCNIMCQIIPPSVTSIGEKAFNLREMEHIYYPSSLYWPEAEGKENVSAYNPNQPVNLNDDGCIYGDNGKTLLYVPASLTSLVIPEGATTIKANVFKGRKLESLTIPSSIEVIEPDAFYYEASEWWKDPESCEIGSVFFNDWSAWYSKVQLGNMYSNPYHHSVPYYIHGEKVENPELKEGLTQIKDYININVPFWGEVELPSTLKRIGKYAFANSSELTSVIMPEGLEEIGESAFEGCALLETFELPSTVISIEDKAFSGCKLISSITLPEGLNQLGNSVFNNCSKLEKAVLVSNIEAIGEKCFQNCYSLNKVYFPLQLKTIGNYAFCECFYLEELNLPATLESIGDYAFYSSLGSQRNISKVIIGDNVTYLGTNAFQGPNISYLSIGKGVEVLQEATFGSIGMLKLSEGLKEVGKLAIRSCSIINLPSTVTVLAKDAFNYSRCSELSIPDGVSELPEGSCGAPAMLTIGSGLKTINSKAIDFDNLHILRIKSETPPSLNDSFSFTTDQNDAMTLIVNDGCLSKFKSNPRWNKFDNIIEESMSDITIHMTGDYPISEEIRTTTGLMPSTVMNMKVVGPLTETDMRIISENMISLQNLDISEVTNVTKIPDNQFAGSLLTEIKLPKNLTAIGNNAFKDCSLLQIAELPEGVTEIGSGAFENSPRVTVSALPASLTTLGDNAFANCTGIRSIAAGEALDNLGDGAFNGCSILESVDFSATALTEIKSYAFYGCYELDEIILPETVTAIGDYAFAGTAIRDIAFASNASEIGSGAFSNCRRLVAANLPEKVKSVSERLFANCPRMIAATMPAATTDVAPNIVNGNKKMANISCAAVAAPAAETGAFDGLRMRYVSLTVPTQSFRAYLNAPQWGKFQSIQNKIPVSIDPGVEVSNVAEEEYQDMLTEDALEEAAEAAAQETEVENPEQIRRRSTRRAAERAATTKGRQFAALFNGAQIQTGNEGSATRIFVNPREGVKVTSILFNGEEMLDKMESNSLLLPAGANGSLVIKTDAQEEETPKNPAISIEPAPVELTVGETATLTIKKTDIDEDAEATWTSSDETVATVDDKGIVTAIAEGTTTITATCQGVKAEVTVRVNAKPIDPDQPGDEDGINGVEADIEIEVYHITGVKIADSLQGLPKGVYIVRHGDKTSKVAI